MRDIAVLVSNDNKDVSVINTIDAIKKAGFIHTDKEVIEKVFDSDTVVKQLLITREIYYNRDKEGERCGKRST